MRCPDKSSRRYRAGSYAVDSSIAARRPSGIPALNVTVVLAPGESPPDALELIEELAEIRLADDAMTLARGLTESEVLFVWDFRTRLFRGPWPTTSPVRWIHAGSAGVDAVLVDGVVGGEVVVTNTRGVFERPIAEYVLALILSFAKELRTTFALQRERRWVHRATEVIQGRRVVILGAGGLAGELAPLLRAAGMEVAVVGRSARVDSLLGRVHATSDVEALLPGADFVVVALPLTSETREYLNERRLGLLAPGARLINVGRGALVDEAALLAALNSGAIAGAALDVFATEPLPPDHPFWKMDQVIVSPHMSGDRIGWERAVIECFAENLRRWTAGVQLRNVVDTRRLPGLAGSTFET